MTDRPKNDQAVTPVPQWMTEVGRQTVEKGYLFEGETIREMYQRVAAAAASGLSRPDLENKFFEVMWKGWLCPASPVLSNLGTKRGLPISCFGVSPDDSVNSIFNKVREQALMSKNGGGVGVNLSHIRGRGQVITSNGLSDGVVPWAKVYDTTTVAVSQGCYDDKTEVLTERGWRKFSDLPRDIRVAQVRADGSAEWVHPTDYMAYDVDEDLVHVTSPSGSVNLLVTANHNMVIRRRRRVDNRRDASGKIISHEKEVGPFETVRADEVKYHRDVVHTCAAMSSVWSEELSSWEKLLIAFQADGSSEPTGNSTGEKSGTVIHAFRFRRARKIERFRALLEEVGLRYSENVHASGTVSFLVHFPDVSPPKRLSDWVDVSRVSASWAQSFLDEARHWDGSARTEASFGFHTTNESDANVVHALCCLAGYQARMSTDVREEPRAPLHTVFWSTGRTGVGGEVITTIRVPYKGKVYCVEVPEHRLIVRRNGVVAVCGNSTRRGASSVNLPIDHPDIDEFLRIRRPEGDPNRQCLNIHHCVVITDDFMNRVVGGDQEARQRWLKLLQTRLETGEPYIMFKDSVNRANPPGYKERGLEVDYTNICCLHGDTLVTTRTGPQRIADLVGKFVEVWDGNDWYETASFEQRGIDRVYAITLADGTVVKANGKHRWFAAKDYNAVRSGSYREVLTTDLQVGCFLEFHDAYDPMYGDDVPAAYAKGFLLGDGTSHDGKVILQLHRSKFVCADKLIESVGELEPDEGLRSDCVLDPEFGDVTEIPDAWGSQVFRRMKGLTARKQQLIDWVTTYRAGLPVAVWRHWSMTAKFDFLAGLFDANGTLSESNPQLSAKSQQLVRDIKAMLDSLAIRSSVSQVNNVWRLSVYAEGSNRLRSACVRLAGSTEVNRFQTGWRKVVSVEPLDEVVPVYCPTIRTTGKFALACGVMTGNSEIALHSDADHSFVCCLSSLNLSKYDEWKDTDLVRLSIYFLDGVMENFIQQGRARPGLENAIRFSKKSRALGLGVLGWHTLLQQRMLPFDSFGAMQLNAEVFKFIHQQADQASCDLANEYGEPEWCRGTGRRNTHLTAIAPTMTNSTIAGQVSAGIEPIAANAYTFKTAKGTFFVQNPQLRSILQQHDLDVAAVWNDIAVNQGSIQHLDLPEDVKRVFLTAPEINQLALIRQAAQRQPWVEQAQSLNLFFPADVPANWFNKVHLEAWKTGVKTLYYVRSSSVLKADVASRAMSEDCSACEG